MDEVVEALEKYQGLVPLVYDIETMSLDEARSEDMPYAVYLKRNADKVISHHKYKRCLANGTYWVAVSYQCVDNKHRQQAERHRKKWLELAKQFKEAK